MSATGGGGAESLGELEIDVSVNTTQAEQQSQQLMEKIKKTGQSASGDAVSGFRAFSTGAVSSLSSVISSASLLNRSFGETSPLAPLANTLATVQGPLAAFGNSLDQDTGKLNAMKTAANGLMGVGAIFVGLAGALSMASRPLQEANAALVTSISNTKNAVSGLPDSISNYTQQIDQADKTGQKFGFSTDQVNQALSQLTEETRSAPEAFKEMQFTETLAVAGHMKLYAAAQMVGRMHAGLFRSLRQFGIDIPSMLANPAKEAATAENQLATATGQLQKAQENLNDFQAKLSAAEQDRQQKFQAAVTTAQQAATNAQNKYQDSLQKTTDAEQKSADASQKAQQTISDNATKLAQDTQSAADAVATAQTKIQDLQQQWADQDSARASAAQDKIQQTADALSAAEQNLADMTTEWTLAPAKSAEEQLRKLDSMRKAAANLAKAQDAAQKAQQTPAGPSAAEQLTRQQQMAAAQETLNKAIERQNGLQEEAAKMALQNKQVQLAANEAALAYAQAQQSQAQAQNAVAAANDKLAKAQNELATAASPTLAEQQQLQKYEEAITSAQGKVDKANAKLKDAQNDQAKLDAQFQAAMNQFMQREQGQLQNRANTWSGHLRAWEAGIKNVIMDLGTFAGPLATAGLAFMGVGGMMRAIQRVKDAISGLKKDSDSNPVDKVTKGLQDLESEAAPAAGDVEQLGFNFEGLGGKVGKGADEVEHGTQKISGIGRDLSKAKGAATDAEKVIGESGSFGKIAKSAMSIVPKIGGAMSGVGSAIAGLGPIIFGPVGLIVLAIAGIALIGYEIYKHWDTISKDLSKAWNWVFGEGKRLFGDFEGFLKRWGALILLPFAPFIALPLLIFQHWGQIGPFFGRIIGDILGFFEKLPGEAEDIITRLMGTFLDIGTSIVEGIWHGMSNAGSWLYNQVKSFATNFVEKPIKDFLSIFSPSRRMADHGLMVAHGLALGILSGGPMVKAAAEQLARQANDPIAALGGARSPGALGIPGAGVSPSMRPTTVTANFEVNINPQGHVVTDLDLKSDIKTFLQQGAMANGGINRFLGVPGNQ